MSKVGKSEIRVDAFDKATGRPKYYEDRMPAGAMISPWSSPRMRCPLCRVSAP